MLDGQMLKRLNGEQDSRSMIGMLSRGKNIYNGGSKAAHSGGGAQFGRPKENLIGPDSIMNKYSTGKLQQIPGQQGTQQAGQKTSNAAAAGRRLRRNA